MTDKSPKVLNEPITGNDQLKLHTFAAPDSVKFTVPKAEINLHLINGIYRTSNRHQTDSS